MLHSTTTLEKFLDVQSHIEDGIRKELLNGVKENKAILFSSRIFFKLLEGKRYRPAIQTLWEDFENFAADPEHVKRDALTIYATGVRHLR